MNIVVILQIVLGVALLMFVAYQYYQMRTEFPSKDRYIALIAGVVLMLVCVAVIMAVQHFGYPERLLYIAGGCIWIPAGLMIWGQRGRKPKSN